jgi:Biogenesis of lysosome-related organelles complex-1 subunit 2
MNRSSTVFYSGLRERMVALEPAVQAAASHADDAKAIARDVERVATSARRLEALVERLDEYSRELEARSAIVRQ